MPITYYDTVNGQLIGETTSGVRTEYLTDALGSVTATVNSSGEIVNTYRYKPYGQLLSKTGSGEDPRYLWTGNTGSRRTLVTYAEQYNQARHYGSKQAAWTTVDPLWPEELEYLYVAGNPIVATDEFGLQQRIPPPAGIVSPGVRHAPPGFHEIPGHHPLVEVPEVAPPVALIPCLQYCIILGGAVAIVDLGRYACTGQTGPFTGLGRDLGYRLYPIPQGQMPGERDPGCSDEMRDQLTAEVKKYCKSPGKKSCKGLTWPTDKDEIQRRLDENRNCLRARRNRESRCFNGGDPTHQDEIRKAARLVKDCRDLIPENAR